METHTLACALLLWGFGGGDGDGDGFASPVDCDDGLAAVHPGAAESCNGRDDNCDGAIDEGRPGDAPTWYADADADGFGTAGPTWVGCEAPAGWAPQAGDCDDADPELHPDAVEVCGNGVDDDCHGLPGDCRLLGRVSAAEADHVLVGGWLGGAGTQLDLGDVSGDGVADLVVGEPSVYDSELQSALWAWTAPLPSRAWLSAAPITLGDADESGLGNDLALADLDGDGVGDLVLSSPHEAYANPSEGLVLAWFDPLPVGTAAWWLASTYLYGGEDSYQFGVAVATGDYDADGDVDLAVSGPYDDVLAGSAGSFSVFTGPLAEASRADRDSAALRIDGTVASGYLGLRLQTLPDADGDGDDELVVASPHEGDSLGGEGKLRVFGGLLRGDDSVDDASFTVAGTAGSEGLGWVSDVGDLDGDGLGDLVVGSAWGGDATGVLLAWFGPMEGSVEGLPGAADFAIEGAEAWGHFAMAVGVDDVDGDGRDDLLVGSNSVGEGVDERGHLLVFHGPFAPGSRLPADADLVIEGVEEGGWLGYGEPRAADLDGDGVPELVVAAPLADLLGPSSDAGVLYVFRGRGL